MSTAVQGYEYTGKRSLILLQFSPDDEDAVVFATCRQLLRTADTLESLDGPALCENDIDLETITDLSDGGSVSTSSNHTWARARTSM